MAPGEEWIIHQVERERKAQLHKVAPHPSQLMETRYSRVFPWLPQTEPQRGEGSCLAHSGTQCQSRGQHAGPLASHSRTSLWPMLSLAMCTAFGGAEPWRYLEILISFLGPLIKHQLPCTNTAMVGSGCREPWVGYGTEVWKWPHEP